MFPLCQTDPFQQGTGIEILNTEESGKQFQIFLGTHFLVEIGHLKANPNLRLYLFRVTGYIYAEYRYPAFSGLQLPCRWLSWAG